MENIIYLSTVNKLVIHRYGAKRQRDRKTVPKKQL